MANYPGSLPSIASAGANLSTNPHSTLHNSLRDELLAVATELGTDPAGSFADVKARLNALDTELGTNPSGTFATLVARLDSMVKNPSGVLTDWVPTVNQNSVAIASTVNYARYQRVGRMIMGNFKVTVNATGTNHPILIGNIVTAAASDLMVGAASYYNLVGSAALLGLHLGATTHFDFRTPTSGADNRLTGILASGHILKGQFMYEAAAD